jgi:hypothetical protein
MRTSEAPQNEERSTFQRMPSPYQEMDVIREEESPEEQESRYRQQIEKDAAEFKEKLAHYLMDDIHSSKRSSNLTQTLMTSESAPPGSRRRQGKTERNFQTQGW